MILGSIHANASIEKASVYPPCDGYYTDFFWQVWADNGTDPFVVAFGDIDPTNDVMPETSELEAVYGKTNAEVFMGGVGNASSGLGDASVMCKPSSKRVYAKAGKPLTYLTHFQAADDNLVLLSAQFVPKNGAHMKQERKDSTSIITETLNFFIRIDHDGFLKEVQLGVGIDGGAAPWNGTFQVALIRNETELSTTTFANRSGDVHQPVEQDDTIGRNIGEPLFLLPASVKAANEFTSEKETHEFNIPVKAGDLIVVNPVDHRGTDPDNISYDMMIDIVIRNAKERKRKMTMDGTHVINYEGDGIMGVART